MKYYVSIISDDNEAACRISTSLRSVSKFTALNYHTLLYQFSRCKRDFYLKGNILVFRVTEIERISRPQYKDSFKR